MLKNIFLIISMIGAVIFSSNAATVTKDSTAISISGVVDADLGDTVMLILYADMIELRESGSVFHSIVGADGYFHFDPLPVKHKGYRIYICLRTKAKVFKLMRSNYLIEAGDSINMRIRKTDMDYLVEFSGRGYEKYTCQRAADSAMKEFMDPDVTIDSTNVSGLDSITVFCKRCESVPSLKVLETYKKRISPFVYEVLRLDKLGKAREGCMYNYLTLLWRMTRKAKAELQNNVIAEFNRLEFELDPSKAKLIAYSERYLSFLMMRGQVILCHISNNELEYKPYSLIQLYSLVVNNYEGIVRDYLLFQYLYAGNSFPETAISTESVDSLWKKAFELVDDPLVGSFMHKRILTKSIGANAFNFSLPDARGNSVSLHDLRGKVLVVDFWYTGCAGCQMYCETLESHVYKEFRKDSNVVFVSISGDKNKGQWLKSVAGGEYTNEGNINLYTDGKGFEHPLTMYYGFNGGPFSLIIDKQGRIFAADPPKTDYKFLIEEIKRASEQ